jgi:hypothetical protein
MTETSQPQDTTPEGGPRPQENDEPNEFGFAGDGTAPQPERTGTDSGTDGESIAVPAGDLTGAITAAIDDVTGGDDDEGRSRR